MEDFSTEVYSYPELFQEYPDQWLCVQVVEREETGYGIIKMSVISNSIYKDSVLTDARDLKKRGIDVAVISTIDNLEEALSFVYFDNDVNSYEYVTPEEYALMFQLYYGLAVADEYLE